MDPALRPSIDEVWHWLAQVPDPEIPVISLTDLGIIRDVEWRDDTLVVTVTPTYSGCPATTIINLDIETALAEEGVSKMDFFWWFKARDKDKQPKQRGGAGGEGAWGGGAGAPPLAGLDDGLDQ